MLLVYRRASAGVQREVLAYCAWQLVTPEAEIHGLAVRVEDQGHGWGRRLLSLVIERARRRGAAQAWLEVRAGNTRARKLYASAGFVEAGRRADYYRDPAEDALILRCALTSAGRHEEP